MDPTANHAPGIDTNPLIFNGLAKKDCSRGCFGEQLQPKGTQG